MNNNDLRKQAKPQEFELLELLFREYISTRIARPDIEYSFQARFQSSINQIPSYLHSSSKAGFFTHFFFGSFSSLLDTKLSDKLNLKKLKFNFDRVDHLRIVAETDDKTHVFIFTENNLNKKYNKNKDIVFTKDEWRILKGREYAGDDNKKLEISVIQINKSTGSINVKVEKKYIQDNVGVIKQYNEITKQCVDKSRQYIVLEDEISKLSTGNMHEAESALKLILEYAKKIYDHYQGLPYGDNAKEADEHGFVAGIFNNFRYRNNAHVYLEQFAGKGYADIVLLVRGVDRATKSIPIIIELKAGTGSGTNSYDALKQVERYTKGFQPNNMRILSLSDRILCVGMNLDSQNDSFMNMKVVDRDQEVVPVIQSITDTIKKISDSNHNVIKEEIQSQLEKTYNTFPGTGEKSSAHYMSRFILGASLVLCDYNKHIFIYDEESYIPTATVIDDHGTRSSKKRKIEKVVDRSNAVNSIVFISTSSTDSPAILVNIIDVDRDVVVNNIRLDSVLVGNRKIVQLNIQFNINKYKESFEEYCNIKLLKVYNSISEYNQASIQAKGKLHLVAAEVSDNLLDHLQHAISSQAGLVISESRYKELFGKIGEIVYPIKSLIGRESEFQGLLEGIFKYYSDVKLSEGSENRALVLTEFQTGAGERIDMLVQAIGLSNQGTKEYVPVGLELKYDRSIYLKSSEKSKSIEEQERLLNDNAKHVLEKLLRDQTERYSKGAAIKSITDGNKVAVMGIVFNSQAERADLLLLTTDRFYEAAVIHSSKLYSVSDITNINAVADVFEVSDTSIHASNHQEFNESNMEMLINALKANINIQNINITENNITIGALKNLCNYLKNHNNAVTSIDLANSNLDNDKVKLLRDLLLKNTNITYLSISNNDAIDTQIYKDLYKVVYRNQKLNFKLKNSYNSYTLHGFESKYVPEWLDIECCRLQKRIMTFNDLSDLEGFLARLAVDTQRLDLSGLGLTDDMIPTVCNYLSNNKNIDFLDVSHNDITKKGAKELLQHLLSKRHKISYLDISYNEVASERFVKKLAKFIKNNNALSPVLKFLNISKIGLDTNNLKKMSCIKLILKALQENTSIEHLDISHNDGIFNIQDINDADPIANMMIYIIYNHPELSTLNLSNTGINDLLIWRLAVHCANNNPKHASIVDLDISSNHITIADKEDLPYFIGRLKKLNYLNISHNKYINQGVTFLLNSLQDTPITTLKISDIGLSVDDDSIKTGFNNLLEKTSIDILDISDNNVGINVLSTIFRAIGNRSDKTLTALNVSGNRIKINDNVIDIISRAISGNNVLYSLDISDMGIDDLMLESIIKILHGSSVAHLNISDNDIGEFTIAALSELLCNDNSKLKWLNIAGYTDQDRTTITSDVIEDLFKALEHNTILTALDMSYHNIDLEGIRVLAQFLAKNIPLECLMLTNNNLDDNAIITLFKALGSNNQLKYLDIRYNDAVSDTINLFPSLKANKNLQVMLVSAGESVFNIKIPLEFKLLEQELRDINPNQDFVQDDVNQPLAQKCLVGSSRGKRSTNECKIGWDDVDEISVHKTRNSDEIIIDAKKFLEYSKLHVADEQKSVQLIRLVEEVKNKGGIRIVDKYQGLLEEVINDRGYDNYIKQSRLSAVGQHIISRDSYISPALKLKLINTAGKIQLVYGGYSTIVLCKNNAMSTDCILSVSSIGYSFLSNPAENMIAKFIPGAIDSTVTMTKKIPGKMLYKNIKMDSIIAISGAKYGVKVGKAAVGALAGVFDIIDIVRSSNTLIECYKRTANNLCSDKEIRDSIASVSFSGVSFVSGIAFTAMGLGPTAVLVGFGLMVGYGVYNGISNIIEYEEKYDTTNIENLSILWRSLLLRSMARDVESLKSRSDYINDVANDIAEYLKHSNDDLVGYAIGLGKVELDYKPLCRSIIKKFPVFCIGKRPESGPCANGRDGYIEKKMQECNIISQYIPHIAQDDSVIDFKHADTNYGHTLSRVLPKHIENITMVCLPHATNADYEKEIYNTRGDAQYYCDNALIAISHDKNHNVDSIHKYVIYDLQYIRLGLISGSDVYHNQFLLNNGTMNILGGKNVRNEFVFFSNQFLGTIFFDINSTNIINTSKLTDLVVNFTIKNLYHIADFSYARLNNVVMKHNSDANDIALYYVGRENKTDNVVCDVFDYTSIDNPKKYYTPTSNILIDGSGGYNNTHEDLIIDCNKVMIRPYTRVQGRNSNYTFYVQSQKYQNQSSHATIDVHGNGTITFSDIGLLRNNTVTYDSTNNILSCTIPVNNGTYILDIKNYIDENNNAQFVFIDQDGSNIVYQPNDSNRRIGYVTLYTECRFNSITEVVNSYYRNISYLPKDYAIFGTVKNKQYNHILKFGSLGIDIISLDKDVVYAEGQEQNDVYIVTNNSADRLLIKNEAEDFKLDILQLPVNNINNIELVQHEQDLHLLDSSPRNQLEENSNQFMHQDGIHRHIPLNNASFPRLKHHNTKREIIIKQYFQNNIYKHIAVMDQNHNTFIPFIEESGVKLLPFYHASTTQNLFVLQSNNSKYAVIDIDLDNIVLYSQNKSLLLMEKQARSFNSLSIILKDYYIKKDEWSNVTLYSYHNSIGDIINLDNIVISAISYKDQYNSVIQEYKVDLTKEKQEIEQNPPRLGVVLFHGISYDQFDSLTVTARNGNLVLLRYNKELLIIKNWYKHDQYKSVMFEFGTELEPNRIYISDMIEEKINLNNKLTNEISYIDRNILRAVIDFCIYYQQNISAQRPTDIFLENEFYRLRSSDLSIVEIKQNINTTLSAKALVLLAAKAYNKLSLYGIEKENIFKNSCFNIVLLPSKMQEIVKYVDSTNLTQIEQFIYNNMHEIHKIITSHALLLNNSHKHRHHHREKDAVHHRERRDIDYSWHVVTEDCNPDNDDRLETVSSAGSSVKPLGCNIFNTIGDNILWMFTALNPVKQMKNLLNVESDDLLSHYELPYWHESLEKDFEYDIADQPPSWISNNHMNATSISNEFAGHNTDYNPELDVQSNLLLWNLLIRKKMGTKYNSQNYIIESQELNAECTHRLAYAAYAPTCTKNHSDLELLGKPESYQ